ncbi:class I SAM-dependent methyltransferase [Halobium salinum]|uniref:Class I SAM-dependent methyltransferase n=1 Tax=Halobium salinum TaxID=1364940 RepID=A0ABD5PCS6_9EURY|nr:class I SAM-dependent methyltransferase [Halobium salinum]
MTSHRVHERWAERSGEYSPEYYAYYGPDERSELVRGALDRFVEPDAPVLELGCSAGRHLAHLHDAGYDDLHGVDVNGESFEVMADAYPDLTRDGSFYTESIENLVADSDDDAFAAVYSVQTLQHIPPENEWVFDEVARIASDLLVTVEVESERGERGAEDGDGGREGEAGGVVDDHTGDVPDATGTRGVNYVTEEIPLYYRNWESVFTERGFVQVDAESVDADTFRALRPATR